MSYVVTGMTLSGSYHDLLIALPLIPILVWISSTDLNVRLIPDSAVILLASLGVAYCVWAGAAGLMMSLISAFGVSMVLFLVSEVIWRRRGVDVLGLGDVKLIGAGFLVVGAHSAWIMILLAATGGIVAALLAERQDDQGIPFGPFLAYAIFVTFLISGPQA